MVEADKTAYTDLKTSELSAYERFSWLPFYVELNQALVDAAELESGQRVVDLACGTGNISRPISKILGPSGFMYAVDLSSEALERARKNLADIETPIKFIEGKAEELSMLVDEPGSIDAVICGNAIHNFSDKARAIGEVRRVLKPGGIFVFNLTFFDGSVSKSADSLNKAWVMKATRLALEKMKSKGLTSSKQAGEKAQAAPNNQLSPFDYVGLLEDARFTNIQGSTKGVDVPLEAFLVIAEDPDFLRGSFPARIPQEIATRALQEAAVQVFNVRGIESSPRNWLQIVAQKD